MRRFSHPRGALLLVILALLTMFGLVAVALVVLTQNARRSANALSTLERSSDPPQQLLDDAMRQIVRGDNISPVVSGAACTGSAIGPHSLLETMYGNTYITGSVTPGTPATVCGSQLWTLSTTSSTPLAGRVITMLSGSASGQSSLIVGVNPPNAGMLTYQVMAFDNGIVPNAGDGFTINGVPFSGAGFGYSATAAATPGVPALSDSSTFAIASSNLPVALLPGYPLSAYTSGNPPGGANSDYTAADFQHMLLAAQTPQTAAGTGLVPPMLTPIPSLHRPELIQYWMTKAGITVSGTNWMTLDPGLLRMIMLRPNPIDHPNFTGSNLNFNPTWDGVSNTGAAWDVDNDGDGIADSVWVDLGMPVRANADGKLYKPLFAILCIDLDGRLNLNAHGNSLQVSAGTLPSVTVGGGSTEFPYSAGDPVRRPICRADAVGDAPPRLGLRSGGNQSPAIVGLLNPIQPVARRRGHRQWPARTDSRPLRGIQRRRHTAARRLLHRDARRKLQLHHFAADV